MRTYDASNPFAPAHARRPRPKRALPPLPTPEEVFVNWLRSLPPDVNLEAAARAQIALLDQRSLFHPDIACLRTLLAAVARDCSWCKPIPNA